MRVVDGLDGRVDVRVGREQHAARQRIDLARLREHLGALHARHPLIADHDRQRVAARLQLADRGERLFARRRADDGVGLPIPASADRGAPPRAPADRRRRPGVRACSRRSLGSVGLGERQARRETPCGPERDSTSISASLWMTSRRTMSRPRPVPFPTGLVVKNGSNMRSRISAGMPGPLSTTRTTTRCRSRCAVTSTRPDSGTASSALSIRFAQIWLSSPTKPRTRGRSGFDVDGDGDRFRSRLRVENGDRVAEA